ncbi:hypothetical protein Tco_1188233, partial [Tanacetum coccineum]
MLKFLQIFQRLHFDLSFADALLHMPKFASTFKSFLSNKEKLFELANTSLNENCSAVLLTKLPEKLRDPINLTPFKTSDSLLEEFVDELALHDLFPSRNEYDNFDPEEDLRKIEYLLNREPSTESSPKSDIEIIDSILKRFTNEPAHVYSFPSGDDDDDNDDLFYTTSLLVLPTVEPEDSFIMRDEDLYTIPEKESDEFIKSSVENVVPILREPKDMFDNDVECDLPFSVTFSNPLFDSNDDFTSSDDESLLEEDIQEDNFKIYSNLLFEFDDEYISSDLNKDEYFDPGAGEIDAGIPPNFKDGSYNSKGDIIYLESLLINDNIPYLPPEVFLDHDPKSLNDEPNIDDLKIKKNVRITFEDRHYLFLTFVIKIFLSFLTYPVNSLLLFSGSKDTIFNPDISVYSFYSLEPVAYESPMTIFPFFYSCPKDKGIR